MFAIKKTQSGAIFGISVARIISGAILTDDLQKFLSVLRERQTDWLRCITGPGQDGVIFDLRILGMPDKTADGMGTLQFALLCKTPDLETPPQNYARDLIRLSQAFFEEEYDFSSIEDEELLDRWLAPFPIGEIAEISRRVETADLRELLETTSVPMGFVPKPSKESVDDYKITHTFRFVPSSIRAADLYRVLLWQNAPVLISIRLSPTRLLESERSFLAQQIALCEEYMSTAHTGPGHSGESTVLAQSTAFRQELIRRLGLLTENPIMMGIEIAAPERVPLTVIDTIGSYITSAIGAQGAEIGTYLTGGYSSCARKDAEGSTINELQFRQGTMQTIERLDFLFDASEASNAFRFPAPFREEIGGIKTKGYRTALLTKYVGDGILLGINLHNNRQKEVRIPTSDRRRHVYMVGQTGTGKSTLLESMIMRDIEHGAGLCVLDPHGDLIEKLLRKIPSGRRDDVIIFDPSDSDFPIGFNVLEYKEDSERDFLIQELIAIVLSLLPDPAMAGPMFSHHSKMMLKLVMNDRAKRGTLVDFYKAFQSADAREKFLPVIGNDPLLQSFVEHTLVNTNYTRAGTDGNSFGDWIVSKFESFVADPMLRNIFGQRRSTIDLKTISDEGKVLLVNLSKGLMGERNSRFFGMVLIAKLQSAVMKRARVAKQDRQDFFLYADEFQNLASENFGVLLAEARKYRLGLVLANQFASQLPQKIMDAVAGNVGTTIAFRVGTNDAESLSRNFYPTFSRFDLMNLPNFHTYVSASINNEVTRPFSMRILKDSSEEFSESAEEIRRLSRQKYGRDRSTVETEIAGGSINTSDHPGSAPIEWDEWADIIADISGCSATGQFLHPRLKMPKDLAECEEVIGRQDDAGESPPTLDECIRWTLIRFAKVYFLVEKAKITSSEADEARRRYLGRYMEWRDKLPEYAADQ